jgi:hypothetical protein
VVEWTMGVSTMREYGASQQKHARLLAHSLRYCRTWNPSTAPKVAKSSTRQRRIIFPALHLPCSRTSHITMNHFHYLTMVTPSHSHQSSKHHKDAASITSSTKPIIDDRFSTEQHIDTASMSDLNGKAPINGAGAGRVEPIIKVQPPRREDLQPSYARVIKPDDQDANTTGWYGGMVSQDQPGCHIYI